MNKIIKTYKAFDKDLKCRGFQYEIGKEYETDKTPIRCGKNGFHACENPIDVLRYYSPVDSRFCETESSGQIDRDNDDTKIASSKIKIGCEIGIPGFVKAVIEYTKTNTKKELLNSNSGYSGVASNSGYSGVASNSGYRGVASNSGDSGVASNSGDSGVASNSGDSGVASNSGYRGVASNSGDRGVASNSGYSGVASNSGDSGVAIAWGIDSKAKGALGSYIALSEWEYNERKGEYVLKTAKMAKVDGKRIKADTLYKLVNGKFIEHKIYEENKN